MLITTSGYSANKHTLPVFFVSQNDSIKTDSVKIDSTTIKPKTSKSFLDDKVTYSATDSMIIDLENEKAYLFNNAEVIYQDMKLVAGYIEIDFANNMVHSRGTFDSAGVLTQKPVINQAGDQYNAGEINYNFDTKKGKIKDVVTAQAGGYVHGSDIKKDSNNVCYVANGKYTTCNLPHPHFYIGAKKIKMIPDDKIVTGPAQIIIADIPTPLVLPFGYFPNKKGRSSGILMPTFGESRTWGFFLKDGGFYWGNNEYVDLTVRGDAYTNGSFAVRAFSNYTKRYKYNGRVNVNYSKILNGYREFANTSQQEDFFVRWYHTQDGKARPGSRFSADVNAGSTNYNKFNGNNSSDYLSNTFQSNIAYSKSFDDTPFNMSLNARHSQNTINKKTEFTLPDFALNMNRIFPLKNKTKIGSFAHKEIEKFGFSASLNAQNKISEYDNVLYSESKIKQNIQNMQNGAKLNIPISTSMNLLRYFTLTPTFNTNTYMYLESVQKQYIKDSNKVVTIPVNGTRVASDYNFSTQLSTLIYGNYLFTTKRLKQIRHVMTPRVTANYKPDFSENKWGYYKQYEKDSLGTTDKYNPLEQGILGGPSAGKIRGLRFDLNNTLEAKVKTATDSGTTMKKVMLIENFNIDASYNAAAKTYKWSNIRMAARTTLFKLISINSDLGIDPYQLDSTGKARLDKFEWDKTQKIGRIVRSSIAVGASFKSKKKTSDSPLKPNTINQEQLDYIYKNPDAYVDFNIPWSCNISYILSYDKPLETKTIAQNISLRGDVNITKKWKLNLNTTYDLKKSKLGFTEISIYRDLHCWEMSFNWRPFGLMQSYSVTINVKPGMLQDLKLTRRRQWQDF